MIPDGSDWMPDIMADIKHYRSMDEDWDSYGSGPISREAASTAILFVKRMATMWPERPRVCPQANGGVLVEWMAEMPGRWITLDVAADGGTNSMEFAGEDVDARDMWNVLEYIAKGGTDEKGTV